MATKMENIITAENAVAKIQRTITSYHALYKADGTIDASEIAELEAMLEDTKLIMAKLARTKKALEAKETTPKVEEGDKQKEVQEEVMVSSSGAAMDAPMDGDEDMELAFCLAIQLYSTKVRLTISNFEDEIVGSCEDESLGVLESAFWYGVHEMIVGFINKYNPLVAFGYDLFDALREPIRSHAASGEKGPYSTFKFLWEQKVDAILDSESKQKAMYQEFLKSNQGKTDEEKRTEIEKISNLGSGVLPSIDDIKRGLLAAWIRQTPDSNDWDWDFDVPWINEEEQGGFIYLKIRVFVDTNKTTYFGNIIGVELIEGYFDDVPDQNKVILNKAIKLWRNTPILSIPLEVLLEIDELYLDGVNGANVISGGQHRRKKIDSGWAHGKNNPYLIASWQGLTTMINRDIGLNHPYFTIDN